MSIFENFPYTNFHELNLDYILKRVKELEGEVADLTALLESGPVVDVKANVGGSWVSQKDGSGNVNLPAGNHSTIGGLKYESTADTEEPFIALNNGGGWEKIPALDANDKIDASLLPPTTDVLMNVSGNWTSIVDGNGDAQIRKASPTTFGAVKVESSNDLSARKMKIYADGQYDALPTLDVNDQIDASAIPDTAVIAGTYGTAGGENVTDTDLKIARYFTVGSDGRLTYASDSNTIPYVHDYVTSIAAGYYSASIQLQVAGTPLYNNAYWFVVEGFTHEVNAKGIDVYTRLVYGTDYTYSWQGDSSGWYLNIAMPNALAKTAYFKVCGRFGVKVNM